MHFARCDAFHCSLVTDAFRIAGEPLFDTSQVDSNRIINDVFPSSLTHPIFMHALVYSMLQISNQNQTTMETLYIKGKTISYITAELENCVSQASPSLIGAVMLLKASSFRYND